MLKSTIYQIRTQLALRRADFQMFRKMQQYKDYERDMVALISRIESMDYDLVRLEDYINMTEAARKGKKPL